MLLSADLLSSNTYLTRCLLPSLQINVDMYSHENNVDPEAVKDLAKDETGPNSNDKNPYVAAAAEPRSDMRSRRSQDALATKKIHLR